MIQYGQLLSYQFFSLRAKTFNAFGCDDRDRLWNGLQTTFCSIEEKRLVGYLTF
jgi:hypothetical protein